ncbi:MAG: aspartate carbamoyltransferase regulatory subunit [Clostridia bacterium]|nr:aspartate carbamoyltransferase regulatory subunit [Clostridia bacterium]
MNIDSITNGYVIDHIIAGRGMRIYELLGLDNLECPVAIIRNATSHKRIKKDIIKIDGEIDLNMDIIGYVDPGATINTIRNGVLVDKKVLELPETLTNVIKCKNPRCITTTEQEINHIFKLTDRDHGVYRCLYCETQAK